MTDHSESSTPEAVNSLRPKLLQASPHGYILIVHDEASDEWVIDLDERMDGLMVAQILEAFQTQMVRCLQQQARALDAQAGQIPEAPLPVDPLAAASPSIPLEAPVLGALPGDGLAAR